MKTEQKRGKSKGFFYSLCVNVFFALVFFGLYYLPETQMIDRFWLNALVLFICFVTASTIMEKLEPYKGYRQIQGWITRLIGAGVLVSLLLYFGN